MLYNYEECPSSSLDDDDEDDASIEWANGFFSPM